MKPFIMLSMDICLTHMEWISVQDRLPNNDDAVLLWLGDGEWCKGRGLHHSQEQVWMDSHDEVCYPTHWAQVIEPNAKAIAKSDSTTTKDKSPEQPLQMWQLFEEVARISAQIEDGVRALIVELAGLDECSDTFAEAIAALKHLEAITKHLNAVGDDLKPKPSLNEVLFSLNERLGVPIVKKLD